ncbi:hypothetical protein CEXT_753121 [Caerostris extrusa]|uniref:Uncharacterized protein n=1 Tax=Caerostris extrusa TaxID=172846 RepID=A0AAV4VD60_CAEEX|nr:hypothetical protein CEXT_753121 [Caerostris extrusa]
MYELLRRHPTKRRCEPNATLRSEGGLPVPIVAVPVRTSRNAPADATKDAQLLHFMIRGEANDLGCPRPGVKVQEPEVFVVEGN